MAQVVLSSLVAATGSVAITTEAQDIVTNPAAIWFEATDHAGFADYEGSGADYDGAFHEIYHIWTVRGEPVPGYWKPQNMVQQWNNPNVAYGRRVAFRFPEPGSYDIDLWCVDRTGVTAEASTTVTVSDQDDIYADLRTICYSQDAAETWAGEAPGCERVIGWSALQSAIGDDANSPKRVLFKRGQLVSIDSRLNIKSGQSLAHIGAWGSGALPILTNSQGGRVFDWDDPENDQVTIQDIFFSGDWDSTREVGLHHESPIRFQATSAKSLFCHVHNCSFDGIGVVNMSFNNNTTFRNDLMVTDCDITDWNRYGVFIGSNELFHSAWLGNRIAQNVDALNGGEPQTGPYFNDYDINNAHGPMRISGGRFHYLSCLDLFNRCGWSGLRSADGHPASADQPCLRMMSTSPPDGSAVIDRIVCEGGWKALELSSYGDLSGVPINAGNFLVDRALLIGTAKSSVEMIKAAHAPMTIRNVVGIVPGVESWHGMAVEELIYFQLHGNVEAGLEQNSVAAYSNTGVYLRDTDDGFAAVKSDEGWDDVADENNVVFAPYIASPEIEDAIDLGSAFPGIVPRYKGVRYNFAPSVFEAGDADLPGGGLAAGATWLIPYVRITDWAPGTDPAAASATDQAYWNAVVADSAAAGIAPEHIIHASGQRYSKLGHFTVAFETAGVRVTNTGGEAWPLPSGNEAWFVRLDRTVNVPAMESAFASPATVPIPYPDDDLQVLAGKVTPKDFFGHDRAALPSRGAIEPQ